MKQLLLTTIAAVALVGCGESQQSSSLVEAEPVAEAAQTEPPTAKSEAPDISIHEAFKAGNIEAVKQHLAAGTDVNAKDENGVTPLHQAAFYGQKEVVELLIAKGADVNAKEEDGWTPLHDAATKEIAELLIDNGADVNANEDYGWTPLHLGVPKEVGEILIANGADVNVKDDDGETPLHSAAREGHKEIAELLIVILRFIYSYEQTFLGDLVRFWYAGLFLFASAYTLIQEGHVRVDILFTSFSVRGKAWSNVIGTMLFGIPVCWIILTRGLWTKTSSINAPLLSFEVTQSGFGMYVKYLMAGFLLVYALSMLIQFCGYFLGNAGVLLKDGDAPAAGPSGQHSQ